MAIMINDLSNYEIVTLAVFLLGGDSKPIDTEDIAVKANLLAPGRFTWRKYPEQINIENVRTFLSDAKKPKNGKYLLGSGKGGWQLTANGVEFSQRASSEVNNQNLARKPIDRNERMRIKLERERLLASTAYQKYTTGDGSRITLGEANAFFRIDEYVPSDVRESKILRIISNFATDRELVDVVRELAKMVRRG